MWQKSDETAEHINTDNRYESLLRTHCDDTTGNISETDTANKKKEDPKPPPPIYIYVVTDYKAMVENLAKAVDEGTYFIKALSNIAVRNSILSLETNRKLLRDIQDEKIIHNTYEIEHDRAYSVVIRELHNSISNNKIENELNEKEYLVRNTINVKHRATNEPLPLFFVDLEP
jgi:hypothetical protein